MMRYVVRAMLCCVVLCCAMLCCDVTVLLVMIMTANEMQRLYQQGNLCAKFVDLDGEWEFFLYNAITSKDVN